MAAVKDVQQAPERPLSFDDFAPQGETIAGLLQTLEAGTYVHAYLISGSEGTGKRSLAMLIARYLLCTCQDQDMGFLTDLPGEPVRRPCGSCAGCTQVLSGNHPDLVRFGGGRHISAESKDDGKATITVGDIREAVRIAGTHTYEGGSRVFIIDHAESMTPQAQNCLLKTLEEPIDGTVFLLLTDSPSLLLPTIISRCRHVKLHAWPDDMIGRLLKQQGTPDASIPAILRACSGSIGHALQIASDQSFWDRRAQIMRDFFATDGRSDIVRVSSQYKDAKDQHDALLTDLDDMLHTLLLVRLGRYPAEAAADYPKPWQKMAASA